MNLIEHEFEEHLRREEAADRLRAIADQLVAAAMKRSVTNIKSMMEGQD